ncbi:MAG TPA: DUF4440 domain-containing protein [Gemmatimonadaceae bacterium]|nr:DUF4440 domain-containing protein [Gemmatimonadaceae bacterium]
MTLGRLTTRAVLAAALAAAPAPAAAQWSTTYEQFYLQAPHNWRFRAYYQVADRLFNAFDYGHAVLYETLWTKPHAPASELEEKEYDFLTKRVLVKPPRVPLEEAAIEVRYARLVPEAKQMFDWAHILHRQIYDVLADERLSDRRKDAEVARLLAYYRSRPDLAFSARPTSMALMQEQPYSLAFRQKYPKFNGLIWAYHWLQVGLYEPLVTGRTAQERQQGVRAAVTRFWQMLRDPPRTLPYQMPMTVAVAPEFSRRYPEAAIVFDNLHSLHDVISDILANPSVPRDRKRAEILRAGALYRDDTSYVIPVEAWRTMAAHMGLENMGGPPVNLLAALPTPTVSYGAVMTHDDRTGEMTGFKYGGAAGGAATGGAANPHAGHGAASSVPPAAKPTLPAPTAPDHAHGAPGETTPDASRDSAEVVAAVERFAGALAEGDSAAALALLTADAVVLEGGQVETLEQYRAHHLPADIAYARTVRRERGPVAVTVRGDAAWARSASTARGEFRGRPVDPAAAELMVLVRTPAGWRISAIHWSSRARR